MTLEIPVVVASSIVVAGCVAVIDPAITSISLAVIAALVVIIPIWFKFKTDAMNAKLEAHDAKIQEVIKTSDGMKDELVRVTEKAGIAKGLMLGKEQAEAEASVKAAAKAEGVAEGVEKERHGGKTP